jgi:hypothetical protein
MTHRIYAKHLPYDDGHLGPVQDEMALCGAPTIYAVMWRGSLFALCGSHRLAACHRLGLEPKIVVLPDDGAIELDGFFASVVETLPFYEFEHIYKLEVAEA